MPPPDDATAASAHDLRTAVTAASGRLQLTIRRIERGAVDLGRLVEDLRQLDGQLRRVCTLVETVEVGAPGETDPTASASGDGA
jgi:signal transduction histidine kinase